MDVNSAIEQRRSIRKFKDKPVDPTDIEGVLAAAIKAPSGKNLQPWHFTIVSGQHKDDLVDLMVSAANRREQEGISTGSCLESARVMREAPILILIYNTHGPSQNNRENQYLWSVNIQSIGAAIQNLLLAAQARNLGTLWICDVFFADKEISRWLGRDDELVAGVALGYPEETPEPRPRRPLGKVMEWLK